MDRIFFSLEPAPPYRLDLTVWALRRRPENIVDGWDGDTYRRVLAVEEHPVGLEIIQSGTPERPLLHVEATGSALSTQIEESLTSSLVRMLGIEADLSEFYRLAEIHPELNALAGRFRGVKPPRFPTVFESLVNAVACQQVSLNVCVLLLNRLAVAFGPTSPEGNGSHALPGPGSLAKMDVDALRALGFSRNKGRAIIELAAAVSEHRLKFDDLEDLGSEKILERLVELRGIGRWSAEYVLLRGLGRLHVFPGDDVGARKRLGELLNLAGPLDYGGVNRAVAPWGPYAGLIYFHLLLKGLSEAGFLGLKRG
ncbi:MAG: hypothetical protein LLG06_13070 [Desulfobacteraceae bacterium]|nr:hypothetical protein [Desulfobacteraceae bacterium]